MGRSREALYEVPDFTSTRRSNGFVSCYAETGTSETDLGSPVSVGES